MREQVRVVGAEPDARGWQERHDHEQADEERRGGPAESQLRDRTVAVVQHRTMSRYAFFDAGRITEMSAQPTMAEEIKQTSQSMPSPLPTCRDSRRIPFLCHLDTATISAAEKGIHGIARSEDVGRDKRRSVFRF